MQPLFIADHLALDFINSAYGVKPHHVEHLNHDEQVIAWLRDAKVLAENSHLPLVKKPGQLLKSALYLRENARELLLLRSRQLAGDATLINQLLARSSAYQQIVWQAPDTPELVQHRNFLTLEDVLIPVAESIANLLVEGNFALIRKCENPECSLWFYDKTKSHQRRWCSMAACGNRMKVAAFRARKSDTSAID